MHIQSSLVFSLSAATAFASTGSVAPTGSAPTGAVGYNSTQPHNGQQKHISELEDQVSSLKASLSSKLAASSSSCENGPSYLPSGAVSRESSPASTASATYTAAYETYSSAYDEAQKSSNSVLSTTSRSVSAPFATDSGNGTASAGPTGTAASSSLVGTSGTSSSSASASSTAVSTYLPVLGDYNDEEISSGSAWKNVSDIADARLKARTSSGDCTYENARVRTEFRSMSNDQRKAFTDAVACLQSTEPRYTTAGSDAYPGVYTRYDEFVATHINMTYHIHGTADFLAWHRNFIHEFEAALGETCGYTGTLPYWDWAMDAGKVDKSEVFNGDEYSMGSNGMYIAGREDTYLGLQDTTFPPGTGGGCVMSGPFSNATYETHLGPLDSPYGNNVANQFDYNPRCLVRDLSNFFSERYNTYTNVTELVLGQPEIGNFQSLMQGFLGDNKFGVHGGGHWIGGGPSQLEDFHSSPSDPVFFIHHSMIDRIYSVWQNLDWDEREDAIEGTSTLLNSPPTADMELSDVLSFGLVAEDKTFGDLMDTMAGPYCYRYE
ncbi:hypothetical protein D0863_06241 [Hortaea werneckii]|uniref:Tyrosinase copper-binding domain-containing protein n=1 Tax=Hortaea werneckii TaxID=91943 RepID=A0A3M7E067_HORWE|nr:hypothetical protein D0863_06241 [Hortaea werneckii]